MKHRSIRDSGSRRELTENHAENILLVVPFPKIEVQMKSSTVQLHILSQKKSNTIRN